MTIDSAPPLRPGLEGVRRYMKPSILTGRTDVVMVNPWLAPVVWEGTFNPVLLDSLYKAQNISIAAAVFAVGKYIMFLKNFLKTAEQHFFVGFKVHIYVFTDQSEKVPQIKMAARRQLVFRDELCQSCFVVTKQNSSFSCRSSRSRFPYERRPESTAYLALGDGDFYYFGRAFGGLLQEVHLLVKTCRSNFEADAKEGIEAACQEESHLNRYMWINKPSKVLSPEYMWQDIHIRPEIQTIRLLEVVKNYTEIRLSV
ncbi:histo-blood group ABO system transferase 2-like [Pempheris klunzingeri]|uniref:histo-blood group ABO system transferase 2-like n=1 Tax=Pempheris klunzingeri TaxID=3127111 RepID=UPI00398186F7